MFKRRTGKRNFRFQGKIPDAGAEFHTGRYGKHAVFHTAEAALIRNRQFDQTRFCDAVFAVQSRIQIKFRPSDPKFVRKSAPAPNRPPDHAKLAFSK